MNQQPNSWLASAVLAVALAVSQPALAGGGHAGGSHHATRHAASAHGHSHPGKAGHAGTAGSHAKPGKSRAATGVQRDAKGKIERSAQAKANFKKDHPCPSTGKSSGACPGYVIDHRQALKRGGKDAPENMQWQTTAAAKAKDKTE
jgi:hypothetical protein